MAFHDGVASRHCQSRPIIGVQCRVTVVSELQLLQPHSRQALSTQHDTTCVQGLCLASGPWSTLLNPFGPTLVISTSSSFSISIIPWTSVSPTTSPPLLVIQRVSGSIQPHPVLSCPIASQGSTSVMASGGNHLEFDMNPAERQPIAQFVRVAHDTAATDSSPW